MQLNDRQRLGRILEYCEDIRETTLTYGASFKAFQNEREFQYSVSYCLLQIGELVADLTEEYRPETAQYIDLDKFKAVKGIALNAYDDINLEVVWEVIAYDIPALEEFCKAQTENPA